MVDAGTAYAEVQARMSEVVAALSDDQLATRVIGQYGPAIR
ncbi:MAG TPA: hypothetical protein VN108_11725 [Marmoricola sp.]|nr:hypothetical protein [Marmoricola sp.]